MDARSDIFSFGTMLYEMVTGSAGQTTAILLSRIQTQIMRLRQVARFRIAATTRPTHSHGPFSLWGLRSKRCCARAQWFTDGVR